MVLTLLYYLVYFYYLYVFDLVFLSILQQALVLVLVAYYFTSFRNFKHFITKIILDRKNDNLQYFYAIAIFYYFVTPYLIRNPESYFMALTLLGTYCLATDPYIQITPVVILCLLISKSLYLV